MLERIHHQQKIREEHHLSDQDFKWSFYCSISFLAAAFGPFVSKFLLNIFKGKRKNTMFVIGAISVVAWLLNCLTKINIYAGWMARALLGITVGSFSSVTAMFLVEIAPKGLSGFYGSLNTIAVFFAQSIRFWVHLLIIWDIIIYQLQLVLLSAFQFGSFLNHPLLHPTQLMKRLKKCQFAEKGIPKACLLE